MKTFNPFFIIGTVGMIVIASLHLFLSLGLSLTSAHSAFFVLYLVFLAFLILGIAITVKQQKVA